MRSSARSFTGPNGALAYRQRARRTSHPLAEPLPGLRLLISYYYFATRDIDDLVRRFAVPCEIIADSGAFSAWTLGERISLDRYIEWCQRWRHRFQAYAVLDDLGSAAVTAKNQAVMESAGLTPVPVYHFGEPWKVLDGLLDRGHRYIMLGSMVGKHHRVKPWVLRCFQRCRGRASIHGLGAASQEFLRDIPWYSVDGSYYRTGSRYGRIPLYDVQRNRWSTIHLSGSDIDLHDHQLLATYGVSREFMADCLSRHPQSMRSGGVSPLHALSVSIGAASWLRYERWLRGRLGPIPMVGDPHAPTGLRSYLVIMANNDLLSCPPGVAWRRELEHPALVRSALPH